MKVFISYSHKDTDVAGRLAARLEAEGFKVWLGDQVPPGDNWALAAGQALEQASAMVVLLSPDALATERVRRDIEYALTQKRFHNRLIPVLVRPTKGIPWILHTLSPANWHESPEAALDGIVNALSARARTKRKRTSGGIAPGRGVRKLARVTG